MGAKKHPCEDCGEPCDIRSARCRACFTTYSDRATEKLCKGCETIYPIDQYNWRPDGRGGKKRRSRCKTCEAAAARAYNHANPVKRKAAKRNWEQRNPIMVRRAFLRIRARQFGLDPVEVLAYFDAHDGRCDSCRRFPEEVEQWAAHLHIDHCHVVNRFRGLLCGSCNFGLGHFSDDPMRLRAAANYLERVL